MAVAAYKYVSDDGTTYQIVLPTDFAAVLSYDAAAGTEPYLPDMISPRWASYISASTGIFSQAVVTKRTSFIAPPNPVTVGGITYRLQSLFGEKRFAVPSGNFQVIAGPQGQKGDTGTLPTFTTQSWIAAGDTAITLAGTNFNLHDFALTAGRWLVLASVQFQTGAAASRWDIALFDPSGAGAIASASLNGATASAWYQCNLAAFVTTAGPITMRLAVQSTVTSTFVRQKDSNADLAATRMDAILIP